MTPEFRDLSKPMLALGASLAAVSAAACHPVTLGSGNMGEHRSGPSGQLTKSHRLEFGEPINAVAWSPSGSRLAVMSEYGTKIAVFSSGDWRAEAKFTRQSIAYSGNSFGFVSESEVATEAAFSTPQRPASILLWSIARGSEQASIPSPSTPSPLGGVEVVQASRFTISKDGSRIAAQNGASSRDVVVYESASGLVQRKITSDLPVQEVGFPYSLAFSPDGGQLAIGYDGGCLEVYDLATGRLVRRQALYPGNLTVGALTYSPDGKYLATGVAKAININRDNPISADIWRTDTGEHVRSLEGLTLPVGPYHETMKVRSLSWSSQGDRLAIGDQISVRVWESVSTSPNLILSQQIKQGAYSVSFSPRGVLAVGSGGSVLIFGEKR